MIDKILVAIKNAASNRPVFYLKLAIAYLGSIIMCKLFVIQIATYLIRQKTDGVVVQPGSRKRKPQSLENDGVYHLMFGTDGSCSGCSF